MKVRATTDGQITIPALLRRKLGIIAGTWIEIAVDEEELQVILTPVTRQYVQYVRRRYKRKGLLKALVAEKKTERCL